MKSQVWLLDPRPNLPSIVKAVEDGFELSTASNTSSAGLLARRYGLTAYASPTRTSPISTSWRESWKYALGESIKVPIVFLLQRRE
jgi:hypothetical protein